jgi:hypothetical protein
MPCSGLLNPLEADVHLLIRDKGLLDPSIGTEQLTTYDGMLERDDVRKRASGVSPCGSSRRTARGQRWPADGGARCRS